MNVRQGWDDLHRVARLSRRRLVVLWGSMKSHSNYATIEIPAERFHNRRSNQNEGKGVSRNPISKL